MPAHIKELYTQLKSALYPYESIEQGNAELLKTQQHRANAHLELAMLSAGQQRTDHLLTLVGSKVTPDLPVRAYNLHPCACIANARFAVVQLTLKALDLLKSSNDPRLAEFSAKASEVFPFATAFKANPEPAHNGEAGKEELNP